MNLMQVKGQELATKRKDLLTFIQSLKATDGNYQFTTETDTELNKRETEIADLEKEVKMAERLIGMETSNDAALKAWNDPATRRFLEEEENGKPTKAFDGPRTRYSKVSAFKSVSGGKTIEEQAYRFGMFALAAHHRTSGQGNTKAAEWCTKNGMELKAMTESVNTAGGLLVPEEFGNTLIDLREQYGVFRQNAYVEPMASDTKFVPRRAAGLTTYWVGEGSTITASDLAFNQVNLTAKKLAAIGIYSSELNEDSMIDFGNRLADEIAYAFAKSEDDAGFNGDGTSTYGGIIGARGKLRNLDSTIANIAGLVVATGTGYGTNYNSIVLNDFLAVAAKLPQYAGMRPDVAWYMHRSFYFNVCLKLALAAGGVTEAEIISNVHNFRFLGYPVNISQIFPAASAVSQVCALHGSMYQAATLGERRQITLAQSTEYQWAQDNLAIKGTERIDINVHDVGNASGTAALRVPGPLVGLITASS